MGIQRHKVSVFYIVLLWLPLFAVAQRHNNQKVESLAKKIWKEDKTGRKDIIFRSTPLDTENGTCYVVVRTDETGKDTIPGFMLITDNNNSPTLLAFDNHSKFPQGNIPDHIKSWIKGYGSLTLETNEGRESLKKWMKASQTGNDDVTPLLGQKEWGQDNPYNLLCPTIDGKHCPTGCVATALSQIMSYHQWPITGNGSITYTTASNKINVNCDFSNTVFEWDKMLDSYVPYEDLFSQDETIIKDNLYSLNTIDIDNNSIPLSKCYVKISGLTVMGTSSFDGEIVLLATDINGQFTTRVSSSTSIISRSSGRILNSKSYLLYIPNYIADGEYHIYCAARTRDTNEWSLSNVIGKDNYIVLLKNGNSFSIENKIYPCCPSSEDVMPISNLLKAVGAAVRMDYKLDASGSNDIRTVEGLVTYLKYDSDLFFAYPNAYTDEQWHEILQQELTNGRPVYYTGQGNESGHAFVIDGFRKDDDGTTYYHVNWGWDGLCNGYYLLNMLRPSSTGTGGSSGSNYSNQPSMLIGMKPEDGISTVKMNCSSLNILANEYSVGDFLPTRIQNLSMQTSKDFNGTLRIELLCDNKNQKPIILYESLSTITSKRGLTNYYAPCQIPTDIGGGGYTLLISCVDNENNEVEIDCKEWPKISIKGVEEWKGGPATQPLKKLAIGGKVEIFAQENGEIILTVDSIVNPLPHSTKGVLSVIISDEKGKMLSAVPESIPVTVSGYTVRRDNSITIPISRYMPDGNYGLRIGYLPQDESLWTYCDRIYCDGLIWWGVFEAECIPFSVKNGNFEISGLGCFEGKDIPWTNNIYSVTLESNLPETVYELSGRKTKLGQKGIYIIRRNHQSVKYIK